MSTVAIVSPGAMGAALGRGYAEAGVRVVVCVEGRSARTQDLAHGLERVPSVEAAVAAADVVLSVVPPGEAVVVARAVGEAARRAGVSPLVADLNAVAPATVRSVGDALGGLELVDGSISGGPPDVPGTRLYLAGPRAGEVVALGHPRLDVRVLPGPVGAASALKMSTASVYKGLSALFLQASAAADRAGVLDEMLADLEHAFPGQVAGLAPLIAMSGSKAHRYVAEMREIAATQEAAGLPPALFEGMAQVWERVAATDLGRLTPEEAAGETDVRALLAALGTPCAGSS